MQAIHEWQKLEQVNEVVYIGKMFIKDGEIDGEALKHANAGRKVISNICFVAMNEFFLKKQKYKTSLQLILLHGRKNCFTISQKNKDKEMQ